MHHTINNLFRNGAERVYYSEVEHVHVSGHGSRDELRELLEAVRPKFFIPVHGEYRQLHHHAQLAEEVGIAADHVLVIEDGRTVEFTTDSMEVGEDSGAGFVFVDGLGIGDVEEVVLRDRLHLAQDGILVVTLAVDHATGAVRAGPDLVSRGFIESELSGDILGQARQEVVGALRKIGAGHANQSILREAIHDAVSRVIWRRTKRRPMVIPVITEL